MKTLINSIILNLLFAAPAFAVSLGQTDDFSNGTTMSWKIGPAGGFGAPTNETAGGITGNGDNYIGNLSHGLDGSHAGDRMVIYNITAQ